MNPDVADAIPGMARNGILVVELSNSHKRRFLPIGFL
jgi:hypothetical protein